MQKNKLNNVKKLKSKLSITAIFLLLAVAIISCSKDDKPSDSEMGGDYNVTAKIDGVEFSANPIKILFIDYASTSALAGKSGLVGTDTNGNEIGFIIPSSYSDGKIYTETSNEQAIISYSDNVNNASWFASSDETITDLPFTITIINSNETFVEGTFSFIGINSSDQTTSIITEGKFKAKKL